MSADRVHTLDPGHGRGSRQVRATERRGLLADLLQDLRYAARSLARCCTPFPIHIPNAWSGSGPPMRAPTVAALRCE